MDVPAEAARRIARDDIAWLTTVTDSGAPAPNPVWFVPDGDDLVVFTMPASGKVHNIERRPLVCLHFNSDPGGGDIVMVNGRAEVEHNQSAAQQPGYVAKYRTAIADVLGSTVDEISALYDIRIRIRPTKVRLTAG